MTRLLAVPVLLAALCPDAGRAATAAAMVNMPLSVRQVGMGDVSVAGGDVLSAWSNPALLGDLASRWAAGLNGSSLFGENVFFGLGGGYRISDRVAAGLFVSSFGDSFDELDAFASPTGDSFERSFLAAGVSGSYRPHELVSVGVTAKYVSDGVGGDAASAIAGDVGVLLSWRDLRAGVSARNLGSGLREAADGIAGESMPVEIRAGAAYAMPVRGLVAGAEFTGVSERDSAIGAGLEYLVIRGFAVRAGIGGLGGETASFVGGFSVRYSGAGLDYAFASHELGATHRVSLSYAFGASVAREAPARVERVE